MKVLILGAGGHARVILDALLCQNRLGATFDILGYLDDNSMLDGKRIGGFPVLGCIDSLRAIDHDGFVVGIGDNQARKRIFERSVISSGKAMTVVHPRAVVAEGVSLGIGTVVFAGAVINTGSKIGPNSIVNTSASVDHDTMLDSHVHIGPGVHMGGTVTVGEGSFIGIGASVIHNRKIGSWSVVGAGATVTSDVPSNVLVVGTPARIVKHLAISSE